MFSIDLFRRAFEFNIFTSPSNFLRRVYKQRGSAGPTEEEEEELRALRLKLQKSFMKEDAAKERERDMLRRQMLDTRYVGHYRPASREIVTPRR